MNAQEIVKTIDIRSYINNGIITWELTGTYNIFSYKYVPWEFDGEMIIPSCILLDRWSETNRSDNVPLPVFVSKMKTR
jgi:hypothetical protein